MLPPMRIWVDADACPRGTKEVLYRACERTTTPLVLVANKAMHIPRSALVSFVLVKGGPDVADDHIAEAAAAGDFAITADIPLAARLVEKGVLVIDPRGEVLDEENVGERLSVRHFMADVRDAGVITGGPSAYGAREKQRFANALDRELQRAGRRGG
jgi:uncharacterized protein